MAGSMSLKPVLGAMFSCLHYSHNNSYKVDLNRLAIAELSFTNSFVYVMQASRVEKHYLYTTSQNRPTMGPTLNNPFREVVGLGG